MEAARKTSSMSRNEPIESSQDTSTTPAQRKDQDLAQLCPNRGVSINALCPERSTRIQPGHLSHPGPTRSGPDTKRLSPMTAAQETSSMSGTDIPGPDST